MNLSLFDTINQWKTQLQSMDWQTQGINKCVQMNGHAIQFRFISTELAAIVLPTFAHLQEDLTQVLPSLTIYLWDEATHAIELPNSFQVATNAPSDQSITFHEQQVHLLYHSRSGVLQWINLSEKEAYCYIPSPANLPYYDKAAPMRMIFHWWCEHHGMCLIHAGVIGQQNIGILLAGRGGSGKSTTTMACWLDGFQYLGDDYVIVDTTNGSHAFSLYNSAKLVPSSLTRLPQLQSMLINPEQLENEKGVLFTHQHLPEQIVNKLNIQLILLPRVANLNRTTFTRVSAMEAFKEIATSTIFQMPGSGSSTLTAIRTFLQHIPVYRMDLGTEMKEIAHAIKQFCTEGLDTTR